MDGVSRNVDLSGVQIGNASVKERQTENGEVVALTIEGTIGGVVGNQIVVTPEWWDDHTPDPTP